MKRQEFTVRKAPPRGGWREDINNPNLLISSSAEMRLSDAPIKRGKT